MSRTTAILHISGASARLAGLRLRVAVVVAVSGRLPRFRGVPSAIPLADTGPLTWVVYPRIQAPNVPCMLPSSGPLSAVDQNALRACGMLV